MRAGSEGNLLWQQSVSHERRPSLAGLVQKANWPMECAAPQHKPTEKPGSDTCKGKTLLSNPQIRVLRKLHFMQKEKKILPTVMS